MVPLQYDHVEFVCPEGYAFEGSPAISQTAFCHNWTFTYNFDLGAKCKCKKSIYRSMETCNNGDSLGNQLVFRALSVGGGLGSGVMAERNRHWDIQAMGVARQSRGGDHLRSAKEAPVLAP